MWTRRGFLGALATMAAGLTLDPEKLLWVPGQKTIVLPPALGWAGSGVPTLHWYAKEMLRQLERNLTWARMGDSRGGTGAPKMGDTVMVDRASIMLERQSNVQFHLDTRLSCADARTRVIEPAAELMANHLRFHGQGVFAPLSIPSGVMEGAVVTSARASVRACVAYDLDTDQNLLRFDTLTGRA